MKTFDEVKQLKKEFHKEYGDAFNAVGNNLSVGIGNNSKTGEFTITARLTNDKLKTSLPENYHGVKVDIYVIGVIIPF
jgi:hypothetical protein